MKIILVIILSYNCFTAAGADVDRIWVNAKINGKSVRLFWDTGASSPVVLYSTAAQRLGLKVTPPDSNNHPGPGKVPYGKTEECELDFSGTVFRTPLYVDMDTRNWPEDGILGWPAFSQYILLLDLATNKWECLTNFPIDLAAWTKLSLNTNSGCFAFETSHKKDKTSIVAVDTGSYYGVKFSPQKWRDWKMTHTNQPTTFTVYYTDASQHEMVTEQVWAKEISIGAIILTDVPIQKADDVDVTGNSSPQTEYEATLGLAALKRMEMIIDRGQGVVYLKPRRTPPLPYQHNRLGAVFVPSHLQSGDMIAHVADGSPAYEAGIRNGDILLNPQNAESFIEQPAGTKIEFTLKRGDKNFTATAVLRNIIPPDSARN